MKFIDRSIMIINLGVILATFLAYLAPNVDPELTWTISFFGLFYPVLLLLNICFIFFWLFRKMKYMLPSIVCILLGWSQMKSFISFSSQQIETKGETISLMTYNISNASFGYDKKRRIGMPKKKHLWNSLSNTKRQIFFVFRK